MVMRLAIKTYLLETTVLTVKKQAYNQLTINT